MEFRDALAVLSAFERDGVAYALVGSMAMAAQGLVRATLDDADAAALRARFGITDE